MDYIKYKQPLELILSAVDGNMESIDKISMDYRTYIEYVIWKVSTKYSDIDISKEDFIQVANECIVRSIKRFSIDMVLKKNNFIL